MRERGTALHGTFDMTKRSFSRFLAQFGLVIREITASVRKAEVFSIQSDADLAQSAIKIFVKGGIAERVIVCAILYSRGDSVFEAIRVVERVAAGALRELLHRGVIRREIEEELGAGSGEGIRRSKNPGVCCAEHRIDSQSPNVYWINSDLAECHSVNGLANLRTVVDHSGEWVERFASWKNTDGKGP